MRSTTIRNKEEDWVISLFSFASNLLFDMGILLSRTGSYNTLGI